jgi:hypothetical protein
MNKRLAAIATLVAAIAAAAGPFASTSKSAAPGCYDLFGCQVVLTRSGPSPATLQKNVLEGVGFLNWDSVSHTVVFANGLCSLTLAPSSQPQPWGAECPSDFMAVPGRYAYTVDGKYPGMVVTSLVPRSVSLTARTHMIRSGTRLTLHGQVMRSDSVAAPPPPVVVLARRNSRQPFEPVATVRTRGSHQAIYGWRLAVHPEVATTYIARVTAQRGCYYPASRCAHPQGQVWANPQSRPFTVRVHRVAR